MVLYHAMAALRKLPYEAKKGSLTYFSAVMSMQFIYVSKEELQAVADYIVARGRVSIAELAAKSNTFIDLEAKALSMDPSLQLDLDLDDEEVAS